MIPERTLPPLDVRLRRGVVVLATLSQLRAPRYGYELRQALAEAEYRVEYLLAAARGDTPARAAPLLTGLTW